MSLSVTDPRRHAVFEVGLRPPIERIMGSNPAEGMVVCPLCLLCVV
jgi:hypothetical protein